MRINTATILDTRGHNGRNIRTAMLIGRHKRAPMPPVKPAPSRAAKPAPARVAKPTPSVDKASLRARAIDHLAKPELRSDESISQYHRRLYVALRLLNITTDAPQRVTQRLCVMQLPPRPPYRGA